MPKEPDLTGAEVVNICSDYMNETDLLLVEKALACASLAHADQYRASGEAYFVHPTQVAGILAKLKLDAVTVSCGFCMMLLKIPILPKVICKNYLATKLLKLLMELLS